MTTSAPAARISPDLITSEIRDRIAWILFDGTRAFDGAFWSGLSAELHKVGVLDIDCMALYGGTNFAVGNNLAWLSAAVGRAARRSGPDAALVEASGSMREAARTLNNYPVVTVAVLAGDVIGAGAELAALTDLRAATGPLVLALPEPQLGVVPDIAPPALLETVLGASLTRRLLVSGESVPLDSTEADAFIDHWCDGVQAVQIELCERSSCFPRDAVLRALRRAAWRNDQLASAAAMNAELIGPAGFRASLERYAESK
ncbi:enoyl-CoA hydratase/isomerase family protein [Nocardia sp. NPDC058114]|uniref:enoyl-CoA hydratase/isomerase family protein n=1 Tax=Nocardia sp. NPDC058114 TaxID=3346346 RepID=UPI0036DAC58F